MIRSNIKWIDEHMPVLKSKILVTLSMEGCIPELSGDAREANVRGGLGIYFGDKLEGLNAIGMDEAFGCMPLYKKRLVQKIINGSQYVEYRDVSYEHQPVERIKDVSGIPMQLNVWGWDVKNTAQERQYKVEVYSIYRGGTLLYLFYCPEVFDVLYPDDKTHCGYGREQRFLQETVFAECVYELLKNLNVIPDILHLNEGHVADAAALIKGDKAFDKTTVIYTNHTVVQAGLEKFCVNRITGGDIGRARYAMRFLQPNYEEFWRKFSTQQDGQWFIDFSKGALEICDIANGVSNEHAGAMRTLFPAYNRPIEGVLNGSGDSWIMEELLDDKFNRIAIDKQTLLKAAAEGKAMSFAEVKRRTANMTDKKGLIISEDGMALNPDLPTIWMVRRMVMYKSQLPILKDIIRVICANRDEEISTPYGLMNGLQMQVVVGGIAPQGSSEEGWIEEFVHWMQKPELRGRFVFVPNADTTLLKMQAIGADICINCPLPEQEACGTSDQRSARNGGINIATRSGGPFEYIEDKKSGMLIGPYKDDIDFYNRAPSDILEKLQKLSDMYYSQQHGNNMWLNMKLESHFASSTVTAAAMEQRYAGLYAQSLRKRTSIIPRFNRESCKNVYIKKSPELVLQPHEAESDFLYGDFYLKNWKIIDEFAYFNQKQLNQLYKREKESAVSFSSFYIERDRFELLSDILKNYAKQVKNSIFPDFKDYVSMPGCSNINVSLLLFWAMTKYIKLTKDYDLLNSAGEKISPYKQITIVQYMLKEIIDSYSKELNLKEQRQAYKVESCQAIFT